MIPCWRHGILTLREIESLQPGLCKAVAREGVRFIDLQSVAVFPRDFNEAIDRSDSKGAALSHWTLQLIARVIALPLDNGPILDPLRQAWRPRSISAAINGQLSRLLH